MCCRIIYCVIFCISKDVVKRHIYFGWQTYEDNAYVQYIYIYIWNIQIPCSSVLLIVFFTGGSSITMRIVKFLKIIFSKTMQERIVIIITTTIHTVRLLNLIILSIFSEISMILKKQACGFFCGESKKLATLPSYLFYLSRYPLIVNLLDLRFLKVISSTVESKSKSGDIFFILGI